MQKKHLTKLNIGNRRELPHLIRVFTKTIIPKSNVCQAWWLAPIIPATQKAEIRRNVIEDQPRQKWVG
jgi:hypothetical protein